MDDDDPGTGGPVAAAGFVLVSDLLGSRVKAPDGASVGAVVDLTLSMGERHPAIRRLVVGRHRRAERVVSWSDVARVRRGVVELRSLVAPSVNAAVPDELLLVRDVLDTQIVDVAGKRIARVSDVVLAPGDHQLRVVGVDVSAWGVWRRLRPRRDDRRNGEKVVDWEDLHLTSARGHLLQVSAPASQVHRLDAGDLADLVSRLPSRAGARVLHAAPVQIAAGALGVAHPVVGAGLLREVPGDAAASMVGAMAHDEAAAVLRTLAARHREPILARLPVPHAAALRGIVERADAGDHPPRRGRFGGIRGAARHRRSHRGVPT